MGRSLLRALSIAGAKAKADLAALAAAKEWLGIEQWLKLVRATLRVFAGSDAWRRDLENKRYREWGTFLAAADPSRKGYPYAVRASSKRKNRVDKAPDFAQHDLACARSSDVTGTLNVAGPLKRKEEGPRSVAMRPVRREG